MFTRTVSTSPRPTPAAGTIAHRACRHLDRPGWLEGEGEPAYPSDGAGGDAMDALRMSSIKYRIATGPHAGRKVATLPAGADAMQGDAGQVGGFSLHAGVAA